MEVKRLFDLIDNYRERYSDTSDALGYKENGEWKTYSFNYFSEQVMAVSYGLMAMGLQPGDKIATLSNNRPEWNFLDIGMLQAGCIHVPVYPTISDNDLKYILKDAEIKLIIVSDDILWNKAIAAAGNEMPAFGVYTFNKITGRPHWSEITDSGNKNINQDKLQIIKDSITPDSLATLLYTSGTTGVPKGVMLSHNNIISQLLAAEHLCPVGPGGRALSFLPLNHVYERVLSYLYMYKGVSIYYAESIEKVADNLKEIKPHIFGCVPRLFERVYDRIVAKGSDLTGIKKKLFFWSLELGLRYEPYGKNGWWYESQLKIARKLVFSKWKEALGNNVMVAISGGAALQPRLARVFWAAGIPILEGYGLTETSPVIAVNTLKPEGLCFGTVGKPIDKVTVKIAEDGEILCKGPNVMLGYYKQPALTAEVIDNEGWFHTGDIGTWVDDKYLKITDRKKEIFKTSGGKYIIPQMLENKLKESRFIEQAMVIGENQKFAAALIVPNFAFAQDWCKRKGISFNDNADLISKQAVKDRIKEEIETLNKSLGSFETIKKFELLPKEWTVDAGELTPKLSLKRRVILDSNKELVDKIFN
jgi:long-chain acyl-CoA synthetase